VFEHLSNCHGEWNALFAMMSAIPFVGTYFASKLYCLKNRDSSDETR
tara:strand:+ start:463 stop:603 length:141 start_codon:yes stop_codon:yes gene_type:complete